MKNVLIVGLWLSVAMLPPVFADAAHTLKVVKSVDIQAPVDKVWATVKDFDSLDKWHPGFSRDSIVSGTNNQPGAVRSLTVKDGPTFTEKLLAFDEAGHSYRYRIIESPLPLRRYVSWVTVKPGPHGGSRVTWTGTFMRKSPSDAPADGQDDATAIKLVTSVYQGGLDNLKKQLGG
jgi:mxaD protein